MKRSFRPFLEVMPRIETPSALAPGVPTQNGVESDASQAILACDLNDANILPVVDNSDGGDAIGTNVVIPIYNNLIVPTVNVWIQVNQAGNPPAAGGGGAAPQAGLVPVPPSAVVTAPPPINVISPVLNAPVIESPVLMPYQPGFLMPTATIVPLNLNGQVVPIQQNLAALGFTPAPALAVSPLA